MVQLRCVWIVYILGGHLPVAKSDVMGKMVSLGSSVEPCWHKLADTGHQHVDKHG